MNRHQGIEAPRHQGEGVACAAGTHHDVSMSGCLDASFVKRFTADVAIHGELTQRMNAFAVTVLFGPSGCGKTTILRSLAGLERPEEGRIDCAGRTWFDARRRIFLQPRQRDVGMLFQDYALFPHLRVKENIAYGLRGLERLQRRERIGQLLERFGLIGLERRYPHQVSGGQQQRIALARAVARKPRLLLLDEPLSALDEATRTSVRRELRQLLEGLAIPTVVVTHDRVEATALADQIVVLDGGRVIQSGSLEEVFTRPLNRRVADIVGVESIVPGELLEVRDGLGIVRVGSVSLQTIAGPVLFMSASALNR
jgi:molybdate transport system ATP-binding protein